jgi:hypothetical protein
MAKSYEDDIILMSKQYSLFIMYYGKKYIKYAQLILNTYYVLL